MTVKRRRLLVIGSLVVVLIALLFVGRAKTSNSISARTDRIAGSFKCPTCQGQSVAQSKASTSRSIYAEIERRVTVGETDEQVRTYLVSRFGEEQLLRPETTGVSSIAWIAPVVVVFAAAAALARTFLRTRGRAANGDTAVSAEDRDRVARALAEQETAPPGGVLS